MITLTNRQARQFLLQKHGLLGDYRFLGKEGVLAYIRQTGCVQFDPVDCCGKNAELALQSRVKGFTKKMLHDLLYTDRQLIDEFDKNLAILPIEEWPYFSRNRETSVGGRYNYEQIEPACEKIKAIIRTDGPVSSADLDFSETVQWQWSMNAKLSRAALDTMYFRGDLAIHHRKGAIKYYDLAENCIPAEILHAPDPLPDDPDHLKWRVRRRIGAVGLLWNRPSDAWLNIRGLKSPQRNEAFTRLSEEGEILPVQVDDLKDTLYCRAEDAALLTAVQQSPDPKPRCELLAPLDCFLWDRKLIKALFGFDYTWEIYTPAEKRKYAYYVLPLLYGDRLIGRVEAVNGRKAKVLSVKNIWLEDGVKPTKKLQAAISGCLKRFMKFNECDGLEPAKLPIRGL